DPGRAAVARLHRQAVPGVEVGIARLRDGVHAPLLGAGLGIVAGDETAAGLGIAAAGHALHDRAVGHERAASVAPALVPVGGGVIGDDLAGLGVERDEVRVRGRDDQLVLVDRHVALGERIAGLGDELRRQVALVLPDQVAVGGIERLHLVGIVEDEEDAVVHDRRRLGGTGGQRPGPRELEIIDIPFVGWLRGG